MEVGGDGRMLTRSLKAAPFGVVTQRGLSHTATDQLLLASDRLEATGSVRNCAPAKASDPPSRPASFQAGHVAVGQVAAAVTRRPSVGKEGLTRPVPAENWVAWFIL